MKDPDPMERPETPLKSPQTPEPPTMDELIRVIVGRDPQPKSSSPKDWIRRAIESRRER